MTEFQRKQLAIAYALMEQPLYDYQLRLFLSLAKRNLVAKSRQIGLSTFIALRAVVESVTQENHLTLLLSTREDKAADLLREAKKFASKLPNFDEIKDNSKYTELSFHNGSRIVALPCHNTEAVRGYPANRLVLDEFGSMATQVDTDMLWASALPTVSRGGRVDVIGTPLGKENKFYELFKESEGFNVWEIPWWECPDLREEAKDEDRHKSPDGLWQLTEDLQLTFNEFSKQPGLWQQEYELSWDGISKGATWSLDEVLQLMVPSVEGRGIRIAGYDPAEKKHRSIFLVVEIKGQQKRVLHSENLAKMSYPEQGKRIAQLVQVWGVSRLVYDAWGIGEGVKHELKDVKCRIIPARMKKEDKQTAFIRIKTDADKGNFCIVDEGTATSWLVEDLANFNVDDAKFIETNKSHMDSLAALLLAYTDVAKPNGKIGNVREFSPRQYYSLGSV